MKKIFSSFSLSAASLVLVVLLFSACKKNDNVTAPPVAGLMAFNLVADKPAGINLALSGSLLTAVPIGFAGYTGAYLPVLPSGYTLQAYSQNGYNSPIASSNVFFAPDKYYSAFVTGNNGVYSNVVTEDNYDSISGATGQAYVRYINAIPDSSNPRITITANGTAVANEGVHYQSVSRFVAATPGQVTVSITNDANIQASRTIALEARKAYTILLVGIPGATEETKAVQIRYVENGTLN